MKFVVEKLPEIGPDWFDKPSVTTIVLDDQPLFKLELDTTELDQALQAEQSKQEPNARKR